MTAFAPTPKLENRDWLGDSAESKARAERARMAGVFVSDMPERFNLTPMRQTRPAAFPVAFALWVCAASAAVAGFAAFLSVALGS